MAITLNQVRRLLESDEPDYAAARRLGPGILPFLDQLVAVPDARLASKAASLAGMIQDERAIAVLQRAARSPFAVVRVAAAGAAQELSVPGASRLLAQMTRDDDPGVRRIALKTQGSGPSGPMVASLDVPPTRGGQNLSLGRPSRFGVQEDVGEEQAAEALARIDLRLYISLDDGTALTLYLDYSSSRWCLAGPWRRMASNECGRFRIDWQAGKPYGFFYTGSRDYFDFSCHGCPPNPWDKSTQSGYVRVINPLNRTGMVNGRWRL